MNDAMTESDWENIDLNSRTLLSAWLDWAGCQGISFTHGNCCVDLSCYAPSGKRLAVEVKDRTFAHDKYGDVFAEAIKQECSERRETNGEYDCCIAVNAFTDNVIALANIHHPEAKKFWRWCPETTLVKGASHEYVRKLCLSLP